jgi:hypothetical protein
MNGWLDGSILSKKFGNFDLTLAYQVMHMLSVI